jgi:uncharacterized membrane protein YidH (DUF202 family)
LVSLSRCDGLARAAKRVQASAATATAYSHFAWLRTRLALERTMMAWQRTAVSLIGFGFAIVQFFEHLQQTPGVRPAEHPHAAQYLGLALISCGVFRTRYIALAASVVGSLPVGWIVRGTCAAKDEATAEEVVQSRQPGGGSVAPIQRSHSRVVRPRTSRS